MRYKQPILDRVESLENQIKYIEKQIQSGVANPNQILEILKEQLRRLDSIKQLIEAE